MDGHRPTTLAPIARRRRAAALGLVVLVAAGAAAQDQLVLPAARDTTEGFVWHPEPKLESRFLAWDAGMVAAPDSLAWETVGPAGLALPLGPGLVGFSARGRFGFAPGVYDLDVPLFVSDGRMSAYLASGTLEVVDGRLIYRRAAARGDPRGTYLLLAGLVIMTWVLLLNVRRRRRRA